MLYFIRETVPNGPARVRAAPPYHLRASVLFARRRGVMQDAICRVQGRSAFGAGDKNAQTDDIPDDIPYDGATAAAAVHP